MQHVGVMKKKTTSKDVTFTETYVSKPFTLREVFLSGGILYVSEQAEFHVDRLSSFGFLHAKGRSVEHAQHEQ